VAPQASDERGVGDVTEAPGLSEDELRALAIDASMAEMDQPARLADHEFTRADWAARYEETHGEPVHPETVKRRLGELVKAGVLACAERYDPRTGRRCIGYWLKGEGRA
jgi:hypothetical protein